MTSTHAAAFNEDNRTPGLGTRRANLIASQSKCRDGFVDLQHLGKGLEAATDPGLRLAPELPFKSRLHRDER